MKERFLHLIFRAILFQLWIIAWVLISFSFLLKKRSKKYTIGFFPYSQRGGDGYQRRFIEYLKYLDEDGITYKIFDVCYEDDFRNAEKQSSIHLYLFLLKNYYKRIWQTLQINRCEKAFVQRGMVPYYYLRRDVLLEKLASKLCPFVVYDYWDAVWVGNLDYTIRTSKIATKITVVHSYLQDKFKPWNSETYIFPIAINLKHYNQKENFNLKEKNTLHLVYTGQAKHAADMISIIENKINFKKLNFKIKLLLICRESFSSDFFEIINMPFDLNKMSERLNSADVGIYAVEDNEYNHGKLAMKSLEYSACQLPQLSTPIGLSPALKTSVDYIPLMIDQNWNEIFEDIYNNKEKRKKLGVNSFKKIKENHSVKSSYDVFKKIMEL